MFPREPPRAIEGFDILERLGGGGAGEVFLARSRRGKLVAIKVLGDELAHDPDVHQALEREAKLCSRLVHPTIVQLRAFVDQGGLSALVFEYVPGVALARLLRIARKRGERLPDGAAWHVLERVLDALAFAHAQKDDFSRRAPIVHRDVSPSNVLVDWQGGVKLTDFGMGKMLNAVSTTRLGLVKGTPGCMAPEQARGERVTERADVYAAALLGWQLATGLAPFGKYADDDVEMVRAMRNPRLAPLAVMRPDLPPAVHAAFAAALEPDPELRTITAAELAAVIRPLAGDAGSLELAKLLAQWRAALEKTVARDDHASRDARSAGEDGTVRYEEVALALAADDEMPHARELADLGDIEDDPTGAYVRAPVKPSVPALPAARVAGATDAARVAGATREGPLATPARALRPAPLRAFVDPTPSVVPRFRPGPAVIAVWSAVGVALVALVIFLVARC